MKYQNINRATVKQKAKNSKTGTHENIKTVRQVEVEKGVCIPQVPFDRGDGGCARDGYQFCR